MNEIKAGTAAMELKALNVEAVASEAVEHSREPGVRERNELEGHAGPAAGRKPRQERRSVEALPSPGPLGPLGPLIAHHPRHAEGPELHRAPGREPGEDAKEGHAPKVAELAVVASKPPSIADEVAEGP